MDFPNHDFRTSTITGSASAVGQRRSNIEIIAEILRIGLHGAGKTEIMYTANMSYAQIQRYLDYLTSHGFITRTEKTGTTKAYRVTGEGIKLLDTIDSLLTMLNTPAMNP